MSSEDPYTDPETGVMKNLLGIKNAATLARAEQDASMIRSAQLKDQPIQGKFDLPHLQAIHKHVFQDVYQWAGELRSVHIGKNGDVFAAPDQIERYGAQVFKQLARENNLKGLDSEAFAGRAAHYLSEINALHSFREGNGRTQRIFMEQLGKEAGHKLDFSKISGEEMGRASKLSHYGGGEHMKPILETALRDGRALDQDRSRGGR